jgi:hypothetical protein
MPEPRSFDWEGGSKEIADLGKMREQFSAVHELHASPDGERIAVPVIKEGGAAAVCVNGQLWEGEYERAWSLKYSPDGRLMALVRIDDMWTVAVEGQTWEEQWEFVWNPLFSDGGAIGVQVKSGMDYKVAVEGKAWEKGFKSCRGFAFSPDGKKTAGVVQVEDLAEGDIFKFAEGVWSVAVDGVPWEKKFINVYSPLFSPDGQHVAAEVRLDAFEYTLAVDQKPWGRKFGMCWEPVYKPSGGLVAPVRDAGAWTMAEDGKPIWKGRFSQLWNQRIGGPDSRSVAAVAATGYGRWTLVVDDQPWRATFSDMVLPPVWSPDGRRVAAVVKDQGRWGMAVDGKVWPDWYDMVWDPVFSPDSKLVAAKVEKNGRFGIAINGKLTGSRYEMLWEPAFSPDGLKMLIRGVENKKYLRQVVPV